MKLETLVAGAKWPIEAFGKMLTSIAGIIEPDTTPTNQELTYREALKCYKDALEARPKED